MRLAYDDVGIGECVLLIHGHPFDRTLWDPQVAALRDAFRVLAPDLTGLGRSPGAHHCVTMRELAADIEELRQKQNSIRHCATSCVPMYQPRSDDLETRITGFTIGCNKTARPWKWKYDADAEHARYLECHPRQDTLARAA